MGYFSGGIVPKVHKFFPLYALPRLGKENSSQHPTSLMSLPRVLKVVTVNFVDDSLELLIWSSVRTSCCVECA